MKTIKIFFNAAEAGFASSLLEAGGIKVFLHGEQSVPVTPGFASGGFRLQVPDEDVERALTLLREGFDAADDVPAAPDEVVETDAVDSEAVGAGGPVEGTEAVPLPDDQPAGRKMPVAVFVAALVALGALSFAWLQWNDQRQREQGSYTTNVDTDHDGRADLFYVYRDGWNVQINVDRDGDGALDEWNTYDRESAPERSEVDDNFDGRVDGWTMYRHGQPASWKRDTDFDGVPDEFGTYKNGVKAQLDVRPGDSKIVIRRALFAHGVLREELVDQDRDGKFDYKILTDEFGVPSEKMPIVPAK